MSTGHPLPIQSKQLDRLLYKYRTLGELRRDREKGKEIPPRKAFQQLAGEFPGALIELDRLQMDEIDRRIEEIETALECGTAERWMIILHSYHALMRAALFIKARIPRKDGLSTEKAEDLSRRAHTLAQGLEPLITADFAKAVARPPQGRINTILFEILSIVFKEPAPMIQSLLSLPIPAKTSSHTSKTP